MYSSVQPSFVTTSSYWPLCYEFFLACVSHYLGKMWLNTELARAVLERGWSLTGAVLFSSLVFTCILAYFGHSLPCARTRWLCWARREEKREIPSLLPGAPMYSHASQYLSSSLQLRPQGFPSENGWGASCSSHFLGQTPQGRGCPPQHLPHIDSTLESLGTLHCLEGANIRSQTE